MANTLSRLRKLKWNGFCFLALLFLWGCGAGIDNPTKQAELRDRLALQDHLEEIVGLYKGKMDNRPDGSDPFPIELTLYVVEEEEGVNEEGEVRFRPSLRARYRRTDLLSEGLGDRNLKVRYYREKQELAGSTSYSPANEGALDSKFLSFTGAIDGHLLDLEFRDHRGVLGYAVLERQD